MLAVRQVQSVPVYAFNTGVNFTIIGGSFFGLRKLGLWSGFVQESSKPQQTWVSFVSGLVTGATWNAISRIIPAKYKDFLTYKAGLKVSLGRVSYMEH